MKWLSFLLIALGIGVLVYVFFPVAKTEIQYQTHELTLPATVTPNDTQLGVVIPKIGANSSIVANVDPYDSAVYQQALTKGVAHAKGTVLPGDQGAAFLFSHSSTDLLTASKYNSVFYLLSKLENGDPITIYRDRQAIPFVVTEKKIVKPNEVAFLTGTTPNPTLTLMTCWPPGTDFERLLVFATLSR